MAAISKQLWILAASGMVSALSDFAVNTQFKIDTDTIVDEDRKNIPKLMLDKFKDYYPSKSGKASILSFTREHYGWMDPSEMIMDDTNEPAIHLPYKMLYPMAMCDEINDEAWFVWRGTSPYLLHEPGFSLGSPFDLIEDQVLAVELSKVLGKDIPGWARKATMEAFCGADPVNSSLLKQTEQALAKLTEGTTLNIFGHSMGAAMATFTAFVAVTSGRFGKIKVRVWGGLKAVDKTAADWLLAQGVEFDNYETVNDLVPKLDQTLDFLRRFFQPQLFLKPESGWSQMKKHITKNLKSFVSIGNVWRVTVLPEPNSVSSHLNDFYAKTFGSDSIFSAYNLAQRALKPTKMEDSAIASPYIELSALTENAGKAAQALSRIVELTKAP